MKNKISILALAFVLTACAPRNSAETTQNLARENEYRLASLENSVTQLNSRVAELNNRVYEVRTRSGQKTSMTVVPILDNGEAPAAAPAPKPARAPQARKVDPAARPAPLQANAAPKAQPARGSLGGQAGGPSGQIGAPASDLALPPADLPAQATATPVAATPVAAAPVPVPRGNTTPPARQTRAAANPAPAVPVPLLPTSDLSLPPEHPGLPPAEAAQTPTAAAPAKAAAPKAAARPQQGEQAAYNAALKAARAGRTDQSIAMFRDFLQKYPNGPYAANAEYWIGECLYAQGKYQDALSEFNNVNSTHPSHHKNADALLKAGMTLNKMGDKAAAQEKYRELFAKFPNSDAARRARGMGIR